MKVPIKFLTGGYSPAFGDFLLNETREIDIDKAEVLKKRGVLEIIETKKPKKPKKLKSEV